MQRFDLNRNWEYLESSLQNPLMVGMLQGWKKTSLPHDYAVEKARSPEAATGLDEGFMACAGLYYRKSFTVEPEIIGQRFWLEFEGIAGITEVWLNKKPIAKHNNPYTGFWVEVTKLLQAGDNEITVYTDNRTKPNSRWYVGCGIYRSVWLHMASAGLLPCLSHEQGKLDHRRAGRQQRCGRGQHRTDRHGGQRNL